MINTVDPFDDAKGLQRFIASLKLNLIKKKELFEFRIAVQIDKAKRQLEWNHLRRCCQETVSIRRAKTTGGFNDTWIPKTSIPKTQLDSEKKLEIQYLDMTSTSISKLFGITDSAISKWNKEDNPPMWEKLKLFKTRLANVLKTRNSSETFGFEEWRRLIAVLARVTPILIWQRDLFLKEQEKQVVTKEERIVPTFRLDEIDILICQATDPKCLHSGMNSQQLMRTIYNCAVQLDARPLICHNQNEKRLVFIGGDRTLTFQPNDRLEILNYASTEHRQVIRIYRQSVVDKWLDAMTVCNAYLISGRLI